MTPEHPFLPKLKQGNEVSPAKATGVWDDGSAKRLAALAKGIDIPSGSKAVYSIPDPWARAILFDRALYDETHAMHGQVLGEWRGLLGILGLRERMGFLKVVAKQVDLNAANDPRLFSHIIGRVLPPDHDVLQPGESWRRFYILRVLSADNRVRPFAFTSPWTLVTTGASYPDALTEGEVPWFKTDPPLGRRLLTDPCSSLAQAERKALAEWVLTVKAELSKPYKPEAESVEFEGESPDSPSQTSSPSPQLPTPSKPENHQRYGGMLKLLENFARDLAPGTVVGPPDTVLDTKRGLGLDYTVAKVLDKAHKPETGKLSDLLIKGDQPKAPRYILIDPDAAAKLGREPKEIVVYRDITLSTARIRLPEVEKLNQKLIDVGQEAQVTPLHWCTPAFFFEKYLIFERNPAASSMSGKLSDPFPGCRPVQMEGAVDPRRIVLPIREDVLQLLSPDYLQQNFSVEWKSDNSALCRLRLEVKSVEKEEGKTAEKLLKTTPLVIVHEYKPEETVPVSSLPYVGVWPNFQFDEPEQGRWKRYYVFESWRGIKNTEDFVVRPSLSLITDSRLMPQKGDTFKVHSMQSFPKYLVCQMSSQEAAGGYQGNPTGLLLLQPPEIKRLAGGRAAALGIDFGTTGTSVYWSWTNDPQPQQMEFKDRLYHVTATDQNELMRLTRDVFLPAQNWSTGKILSVYQVFNQPTHAELLDGHVLFGRGDDPGTFIVGNEGTVRSDLKWGDEHQFEAAMGFLSQLCMQSLAELVLLGANKVSVRYSYPTAFSTKEKGRFVKIWERVVERLQDVANIDFPDEENQLDNREAVAATRYFASLGVKKGLLIARGALTIDIGGGTTDIALWSKDPDTSQSALMGHLSVRFAGRDIFLKPIRRRPSVLADLDPKADTRSLTDRTPGTDAYNAQLDALIAANGDKMLKDLPQRGDKVTDFLAIMGAGLCGLGFYAGLLAGGLAKAGRYKPGDQIPVFVGGNGSRLLRWCALNYFQPGISFYDEFAACVLEACRLGAPDLKARVQINLSPRPKEEVAFGLVGHGLGNDRDGGSTLAIHEYYLSGEDLVRRNGSPLSWSDSPTADNLRELGLKVDPKLTVLRAFVKAAQLAVDEDTLSYMADYIDSRLGEISEGAQKLTGKDVDARAMDPLKQEPVFIMALKKLIQIQTDEWANHA